MKFIQQLKLAQNDVHFKLYIIIIGIDEAIKLQFQQNEVEEILSILKIVYSFAISFLLIIIDAINNKDKDQHQQIKATTIRQSSIAIFLQNEKIIIQKIMKSRFSIFFVIFNNIILFDYSQNIFQQFYFQFIIKIWILNLIFITFIDNIRYQVLLCTLIFSISIATSIIIHSLKLNSDLSSALHLSSLLLNFVPLHATTLILIIYKQINSKLRIINGISKNSDIQITHTQFNERDVTQKTNNYNRNFTTYVDNYKEQKDGSILIQKTQNQQTTLNGQDCQTSKQNYIKEFSHIVNYEQNQQPPSCVSLELKAQSFVKSFTSKQFAKQVKDQEQNEIQKKPSQINSAYDFVKSPTYANNTEYSKSINNIRKTSEYNKYYQMNLILNQILDGLSSGVILLDVSGKVEFANQKSKEMLLGSTYCENNILSEILMSQPNAWYDKIVKNENSGTFDIVPSNLFLDELSVEDMSMEDDRKSIKSNYFNKNKQKNDQQKLGLRSLTSLNLNANTKAPPKFSSMKDMFDSLIQLIQRFQLENDILQYSNDNSDEDYEYHKNLLQNMWQNVGSHYKILAKQFGKKYHKLAQPLQKNFTNQTSFAQNNYTLGFLTQGTINTYTSNYNNNSPNQKRILEITISPVLINSQFLVLCSVRDVTHFNQIKLLKAVNKNKSTMLNQVSHEIRNPLSCMIEILNNLRVEKNQEDMMNIAISSAELLKNLLNDLLDMAQVSSGKFKLHQEQFSLYMVILEIKKMMDISAELKKNKIIIEIENDSGMIITSDQYRIRQIIINLVSNAIKYTSKGKIIIGAKNMREPEYIKIYVKDTGVGIKPDQKVKLFKAFEKIEDNRELNPQGVGLGLVISNILAKNLFDYKKNLNIYFKPGIEVQDWESGTEFSFIIYNYSQAKQKNVTQGSIKKYVTSSQAFSAKLNSSQLSTSLNGEPDTKEVCTLMPIMSLLSNIQTNNKKKYLNQQSTKEQVLIKQLSSISEVDSMKITQKIEEIKQLYILIVDDSPFNAQILEQQIIRVTKQEQKFHIKKAYNGEECLQIIKKNIQNKQKTDLIFMDQEMPGLNGEQTATILYELSPQIPICFCSGNTNILKLTPNVINQLIKPINNNDLLNVLKIIQAQ